jgi:hypothetical protein
MKKITCFILLLLSIAPYLKAQKEVIGNGQQWTLGVSNFKILEERRNNVVVQFDLTNTGKLDIDLPYNTPLENIEVVFDDSLKQSQYAYFQYLIKEQLANEELFLPVGLVKLDFQTEILLPKNNTFKSNQKSKNKAEKDFTPIPISTKKAEKKDSTTSIMDTVFVQKDTSVYLLKEDSIAVFSTKNTSNLIHSTPCLDKVNLKIDSIFIKKKTKREFTVHFLISNNSTKIVNFGGETPDLQDNISVKSYFSLLGKKTNGAIFARGMYIDKEVNEINKQLLPFQSVWLEMAIPLKLKTKFTPYAVLEINGTNTVEECSTDDNFIAIKID